MGNKIVHTGGHGTGTSMKMVVNLIMGHAMAAFAEAIALGEGLGFSSKMLFDSLLGTPAVAMCYNLEFVTKRDTSYPQFERWCVMPVAIHNSTYSAHCFNRVHFTGRTFVFRAQRVVPRSKTPSSSD
jgi:hypothetical protein